MKLKNFLLLALVLVLSACGGDEEKACTSASSIDDPNCVEVIDNPNDRPATLLLKVEDSFFYDQNSGEWVTLTKERVGGGILGITLPIYSDFLNEELDVVTDLVLNAENQVTRPGANDVRGAENTIPYLEVDYEQGVEYIFSYVKTDLITGNTFEKEGQLIIKDGRAILPIVNKMFNNLLYSSETNAGSSSRASHSISIVAQQNGKRGSEILTVRFETLLKIPNTEFFEIVGNDARNYTLENRWNYYYDNNDGVPNQEFYFVKLKDKKPIPEQIPLDLRIVFQEPPAIEIIQETFVEIPFDLDQVKANQIVIPTRGNTFYTKTATMNSQQDFKMRIKNDLGQEVTLTNQREIIIPNLPGGTAWDLDFFIDFTQNPAYNTPSGRLLLDPLKPECYLQSGNVFDPLSINVLKNTIINAGGYYSVCHPVENKPIQIDPSKIAITPFEQTDSYFGHFNYIPEKPRTQNGNIIEQQLGNFQGIRRVIFRFEGCLRVSVREVGTSAWTVKTLSNKAQCGEAAGEGWVFFSIETQKTIFDNTAIYSGTPGLENLIQLFGTRPQRQSARYKFNGILNEPNHIH